MLRFQAALASALAPLLVVPVLATQGHVATLQDALAGTLRALEVLKTLERRLQEEPASALGLLLSATEAPSGDDAQSEQRLEALRNEVNLLQMELDALQSPVLAPDGAVQSALGAALPGAALQPRTESQPGITTGIDDGLRALLAGTPPPRALPRTEPGAARDGATAERGASSPYSADPLRHGIACYRAGRYGEAYELLAPLDGAVALYWKARTLERLERLDDAIDTLERALARGAGESGTDGFEQRRAQTDLEFLRWKRDFLKSLPAGSERAGERVKEDAR